MSASFFDLKAKRVFVAGSSGMVGSAVVRRLQSEPCVILSPPRAELDLSDRRAIEDFMRLHKPDLVIMAAAKVGGILANDRAPVDFLVQNLDIELNVIKASHEFNVSKLVFLGSSCIYPKFAESPIVESSLLTGALEPTNEWYAIAKIAGIKLCQAYRKQFGRDFVSCMPTNLYGPNDNFDLETSHVLPALIAKAHQAKIANEKNLVVWGTGQPMREFLHVDDCADAIVHIAKYYSEDEHINVGFGDDTSIARLAELVMAIVGFDGELLFDRSKPDGTLKKLMDSSKLRKLGWSPKIGLRQGIADVYRWYLENDRGANTVAHAGIRSGGSC